MSPAPFRAFALTVAATGALISSAHAAAFTWNGTASANWSATTPWSTGVVPANDGTADITFTGLATAINSTVNPAALTPSTNNWSVHSLTFPSGGAGSGSYNFLPATSATLTIGAGGITQSENTGEGFAIPLIMSANQTWNLNNAGGSNQSLVISNNLTLNNNVNVTINGGKNLRIDSGTTTFGTNSGFILDGVTIQTSMAQLNSRIGDATHPLTITNTSSLASSFTTNNSAGVGSFVPPINFLNGLANANFNFFYGQFATVTCTGAWSGAGIVGGGVNGHAIIAFSAGGATYDDSTTWIKLQGNSSGLTSTADPATGVSAIKVVAGTLVLDNPNALGTGNSLGVIFGNNSSSWTNGVSGIEATSGNNVAAKFFLRDVVNGSNQRPQVGVLGLSGAGSVNFTGGIYLDNQSSANYLIVPALKLTAPASGTATFSGVIQNMNPLSNTSYPSVTVLGGGAVALTGNNTYNGTTSVRGGTLLLGNNNAMGAASTNVLLGGTVTAPTSGDVVAASTTDADMNGTGTKSWSAGIFTWTTAAPTTMDGVSLSVGNRILVKDNNSNPERNGVYVVTDATHWTRSTDLNAAAPFVAGLRVHVTSGTLNGAKNFYLTNGLATTAVLNSTAADNTASMFLFNPDAPSNANAAILTNGPYTISRNISVTNNLSTGQSILGGNTSDSSTFSGTVTLSKNLAVQAATGGTVTFSGDITGSNNVSAQGSGTVVFSAAKSYTGTTTVTSGTLQVDGTLASSSVSVASGATLSGIGNISHGVSVSGIIAPGDSGNGTLTVGYTSFAAGSTLAATVNGYSANQLVSAASLNLNGVALTVNLLGIGWAQPSYVIAQGASLSGTFSSVPTGYAVTYTSTQAILRSLNAYYYVSPTGSDTLNNGASESTPFATIAHAAPFLGAGCTCLIHAGTYNGALTVLQATPANSRIAFQNYAGETVNIGGAVTLNNILTLSSSSGATFNSTGDITGSSGIIKESTGSAVFTGNKSYTGTTSVTGGTLIVNGSLASSAVSVSSGATLAGTGSITNGLSVSGIVNPGTAGIGTLTVGSASFTTGGTIAVGINGSTYGLLNSTGALNLTGATLSVTQTGSGWTQSSYVVAQGSSLTGTFASVPDGYAVSYSSTQVTLTAIPAYYVFASGGSDTANNGKSVGAPFATISKAASVMGADIANAQANHTTPFSTTCYVRSGTYRETVTVPVSGTASAPITFKAYNNETVTICGTDPIPGWTLESPNVYRATAMPTGWVSLGDGNQVFQNGVMQPLAGWPKKDNTNGTLYPWRNSTLQHPYPYSALGDWSYVDSATYTTVTSFADAQLPPRSDGYWNGAHIHIMSGYGWYLECHNVTGYTESSKTIVTDDTNVSPGGAGTICASNEYYLTGIKAEMSTPGEWFYDTSTGMLDIWSTTVPTGVEVKSRLYGFNLLGKSFVNLVNLSFLGCTIQNYQNNPLSYSTDCTFNGLSMKYLVHNESGGADYGLHIGPRSVLRNSELAFSSNGMIDLNGPDIRVINNNIHNNAYLPDGASAVDASNYVASGPLACYRNLVSHNTIHNTGHSCIGCVGHGGIIEYNDLYDGMNLSTDGGVLYSAGEAGNTVVRYNLIHDAQGPAGHVGNGILGFYLDCENSRWIVHHNIIWNLPFYAMQFNSRGNFNMVFNNTCWNCAGGSAKSDFWGDGYTGNKFYNNLFNGSINTTQDFWANCDLRNNLYTDPSYVNSANRNFQLQSSSPAIDAGMVVTGVTDGYLGSAPDLGALEYGAADWTASAGCHATPPSPDPVYTAPNVPYANQVVDGSFESGSLSPNWTVASGSNLGLTNSSAWYDVQQRSGYFAVQFGGGTSEISQVVTGLLPNTSYKFYCGVEKTDAAASVKIGVRSYGSTAQETVVPTTSTWQDSTYDPVARIYSVTFTTGSTNTSATIYVDVTRTVGSFVAPKATDGTFPTVAPTSVYLGNYNTSALVNPYYPPTGVYVDDLSVQTN